MESTNEMLMHYPISNAMNLTWHSTGTMESSLSEPSSEVKPVNLESSDGPREKRIYEVAEIKLTYTSDVKPSMRPKISGSKDAYNVLLENWDKSKVEFIEQFKVMLLNRANKVLGIFEVSSGSSTGTIADPKLIFAAAIKANACGIIMAHNHPSGNLNPSQADIDLTKRMKEGGKFLEIQVLDHVIVTIEGYFSFADEGLL